MGGAHHNFYTADVHGRCFFYEAGGPLAKLYGKETSSLTPDEEALLRDYVKLQQARCLYSGDLHNNIDSGLFSSQESTRLDMASENQQELSLMIPRFPYGVIHEGSSSVGGSTPTSNVRRSLIVDSIKEDALPKRSHITANYSLLNSSSSSNNIPSALPLLSSSCKSDPPLLQDLPWFANHALEEEDPPAVMQTGFPLVRPPLAAFSNSVSLNVNPSIHVGGATNGISFSAANANAVGSSLMSLLGENDAELCVWQAHIVAHPLFEQLLGAHLACLRMGTPSEHWPDAQTMNARLALSKQELDAKYLLLARNAPPPHDKDNLDHFMLSFTVLLQTFREQLREHIQVHEAEASCGYAELKEAFLRLTGETSLYDMARCDTMSEDEEDMQVDEGGDMQHRDDELHDPFPFNNMACETIDKCLMQSVRKELKLELKQNYRSKLWDVREEIMRKRRAGKLPGTTTSLLKDWWDAHSKWPYPTEDEKMKLVQETGLELKQINNWFINQRKRNWNTIPPYDRSDMDEFALYGPHPSC